MERVEKGRKYTVTVEYEESSLEILDDVIIDMFVNFVNEKYGYSAIVRKV